MKAEKPKKPLDAVLVSCDEKTFELGVQRVNITSSTKSDRQLLNMREKKPEYVGKAGRKFVIIHFTLGEKSLIITDFFRAVLVDPEFYVRHQFKNGVYAIVCDEFTLSEVWTAKRLRKKSDFNMYRRLVSMLGYVWHKVASLKELNEQMTEKYFKDQILK